MKKAHKICIISHAHITNNPRVYKEAVSLANAGYDVYIVTLLVNKDIYQSDLKLIKDHKINFSHSVVLLPGQVGALKLFYLKSVRKSAQLLSRYFNFETAETLSYAIHELLQRAEKLNADLYIGHNEPGLWAGVQLMKKNKKVAFDFEDWYSHDYLVPGRTVNLLSGLEKEALQKAEYISTTSEALAETLSKENNSIKPVVIYNAFSKKESRNIKLEKKEKNHLTLYWFSQSIGPGRGIEQIINAVNLVNQKIVIHLRGNISEEFKKHLQSKLTKSSNHEIIFHNTVPPVDLVRTMQEYDLGLSLELKHPPSRDLTVTNKILHYLLAGIPVLASDTAGQKEIAAMSRGAVEIINLDDPQYTANVIINLMNDRQRLSEMRKKAIEVACQKFNWEEQEKIFLSQVEKAILN
jgi:glycosyltransferase involved in cell wall biosynthesis